jgi:uracil-DNA glycosylase
MDGFFSASEVTSKRPSKGTLIPKCGACGLFKTCNSPKMPVHGSGRKGILIVGEAPGLEEDKQGRPFVGPSGQLLRKTLSNFGIAMEKDCWITNTLVCRPERNSTPTAEQIDYCRPNIVKAIRELKPKVIIALGGPAVDSIIGWLWKPGQGKIMQWAGWQVPSQRINAWVCPTFHPSFVLRSKEEPQKALIVPRMFEQHLQAAVAHEDRPFDPVPDYKSQVEAIADTEEAAKILRKMIRKGGAVSVDYETTGLKPDNDNMQIVCCGVSWQGRKTIAYPWQGEAITATYELLRSDLKKVGANIKFEERWTLAEFGRGVRNWEWDTMVNSHIIDQRSGITSVKFQAFVLLGQEEYNSHIQPYLEAPSPNQPNRIREVKLQELLTYCAMDALLEYKITEIQRERLGFPTL